MINDINRLIEYLQGTCKPLYEACDELGLDEDALTTEQLEHIDQEIFRCSNCGWWYSAEESTDRDGEQVCEDCNEE